MSGEKKLKPTRNVESTPKNREDSKVHKANWGQKKEKESKVQGLKLKVVEKGPRRPPKDMGERNKQEI